MMKNKFGEEIVRGSKVSFGKYDVLPKGKVISWTYIYGANNPKVIVDMGKAYQKEGRFVEADVNQLRLIGGTK